VQFVRFFLYYKELKQLKIFLTQIGSAAPLADPPVICFWNWIGWKDYGRTKNCNLESVSAKIIMFFTQPCITHRPVPALGPLGHAPAPRARLDAFLSDYLHPSARTGLPPPLVESGRRHTSNSKPPPLSSTQGATVVEVDPRRRRSRTCDRCRRHRATAIDPWHHRTSSRLGCIAIVVVNTGHC
jgi:hypothetical protein